MNKLWAKILFVLKNMIFLTCEECDSMAHKNDVDHTFHRSSWDPIFPTCEEYDRERIRYYTAYCSSLVYVIYSWLSGQCLRAIVRSYNRLAFFSSCFGSLREPFVNEQLVTTAIFEASMFDHYSAVFEVWWNVYFRDWLPSGL